MTKKEALKILRETYHTEEELKALETLIPNFIDENEKIKYEIVEALKAIKTRGSMTMTELSRLRDWLYWLENIKTFWNELDITEMEDIIYFLKEAQKQAKTENDFQNAVSAEDWIRSLRNNKLN